MSYPESIEDVQERTITVATFQTNDFATYPTLVRCYADMVDAAVRLGGEAESSWGGARVDVVIPKTEKQLREQLEVEQDRHRAAAENYRRAMDGDPDLNAWARDRARRFATAEGLPAVPADEDAVTAG